MSDREELRSLAERVEALSGPCRKTDREIAKATGWVPDCINAELWKDDEDSRPEWWFSDAFGMPAYTASIDSAMSLVGYQCGRPHNVVIATGHGSAYIVPNDGASYGVNDDLCVRGRASGDDEVGRTARAIVAASLRAIGEGL